MKISKYEQLPLHSRTKLAPIPFRNAPTILICLSSVAAIFFSGFHTGVYIHDRNLWKSFTLPEMKAHFECNKAFATTRTWWTSDQWREVRDLYRDFARKNKVGTYQMAEDTFDFSEIAEPFQASEEKGRGLKAARDIHEGEIIFRTTNNTIAFIDGLTYRKFLFALEELFPTFSCDIIIWNWMQDLDDEGLKFGIVVDLNDNNLLNRADEKGEANVRCGKHSTEEDGCDMKDLTFYASRDISRGEELLGVYDDFVSSHSRLEIGL